jgi:hypothetical protein
MVFKSNPNQIQINIRPLDLANPPNPIQNFVLFTSHTRDFENFSVVSVLAFILPTPGGGVVKVTKDHKKSAALWDLITL